MKKSGQHLIKYSSVFSLNHSLPSRINLKLLLLWFGLLGLQKPTSLALDWITKEIYWVDSRTRSVHKAFVNGSHQQTLVTGTRNSTPSSVIVLPCVKYVVCFWLLLLICFAFVLFVKGMVSQFQTNLQMKLLF